MPLLLVQGCTRRSWLTLFAFGYNAASNAVLFMDFVVVSDLSASSFNVDPSMIAWTYSLGLLTTLPAAFLVAYFLPRCRYVVFGIGVFFDVLGAWLRWLSLLYRSWTLCMVSTVCIGVAFAVCCMTYAVIGERWFPLERQTLATSIGVQSNYAGWCIGAFVLPSVVHSRADHLLFLLVQAVCVSFALLLFFFFHDERAARPSPSQRKTMWKSLSILATRPRYLVKMLAYGILGAVSYTIPAVQDVLIGDALQVGPTFTKWTNTAFIASGVVMGLLLSMREARRSRAVILAIYVGAVIALTLAAAIVHPFAHVMSSVLRRGMLVGAMAIAGATSLGFLGIALAEITHDVPEVEELYSAGVVEWLVQAGGGILSQVVVNAHGFQVCSALVFAATCLLGAGTQRASAAELECAHSPDNLLS